MPAPSRRSPESRRTPDGARRSVRPGEYVEACGPDSSLRNRYARRVRVSAAAAPGSPDLDIRRFKWVRRKDLAMIVSALPRLPGMAGNGRLPLAESRLPATERTILARH